MWRRLSSLLLVLALVGCPWPGGSPAHGPSDPVTAQSKDAVTGLVQWASWQVQAALSEVASASTVSLINTTNGETVATTVTDGQGRFRLSFPSTFRPDPNVSYYLEAVKGLNSNAPGKNAARLRTIARNLSGWVTLTNTVPGSGIVLSATTTAVAIGGALRGVTDYADYMGSVSGTTYTPPAASPLTSGDASSVLTIVNQTLAADGDPVAQVTLSGSTWQRVNSGIPLALTQLGPTSGMVGATIQATGSALSQNVENVVSFNGVAAASVASPTGTTLSVVVPSNATSGQTTIRVGSVTALGPLFTVLPKINSVSPRAGVAGDATGRTGSLLTISGDGFGSTGTVTLNGTALSVVNWSTRTIVAALPFGATSGPVAVTAGGNNATGPSVTVVANSAPQVNFDGLATGTDPSISASDGGGAARSVQASSGARSAGNVLRFTAMGGGHRVRFPGFQPTKTVVVAGFWVRGNSSVNNWWGYPSLSGNMVVPVAAAVWGTPWLTTYPPGGSYPFTIVPDSSSAYISPSGSGWQYVQATASAQVGSGYEYGVVVWGNAYSGNDGLMFDVDDLVLFDCDP